MGVFRLVVWGLLIGVGAIGGFYVATGEVPNNGDAGAMFDDPSREEVNGERIRWIELREDGVYAGTNMAGFGPMGLDVYVTPPSGERHKMFEERRGDIDDSIVYSYNNDNLKTGNYTVDTFFIKDTPEESHTVYLEPSK